MKYLLWTYSNLTYLLIRVWISKVSAVDAFLQGWLPLLDPSLLLRYFLWYLLLFPFSLNYCLGMWRLIFPSYGIQIPDVGFFFLIYGGC